MAWWVGPKELVPVPAWAASRNVSPQLILNAGMPMLMLQAWGCVIGKDYPRPIIDHATQLKSNLARMKAAYASGSSAGDTAKKPATKKAAPESRKKQKTTQ